MPVFSFGFSSSTVSMCFNAISNCTMIGTPSGIPPAGTRANSLLAAQRLPLESSATPRTLPPTVKLSVFDGSSAEKRTTVFDCELLTQTRFCGVDRDAEGRLQARHLDDPAVLHAAAGEVQQAVARAVGHPDVAVRREADPHHAAELARHREVASVPIGLSFEIHQQDRPVETADPDPVLRHAGAPADAVEAHAGEPVIGGDSGVPSGANLAVPPPMLVATPDCEPGIQLTPLQTLPSASIASLPGASVPPPSNQSDSAKSGGAAKR